jgi:hypothetical protein
LITKSTTSTSPVVRSVTITVVEDKLTCVLPAVGTVRDGLFNLADFAPAAADPASLTALLNPVTDVDNFAANTSSEVVTKSFNTLFVTFFGTFRAGPE